MTRVLHLNTHLLGGAARAAWRLHAGLVERGVESSFLHAGRHGGRPGAREWPGGGGASKVLHRAWRWARPRGLGAEELNTLRQPRRLRFEELGDPLPDVLHLHWVADWFDLPALLRSVPHRVPIVWTLHDQQPHTGGCHYAEGCERFRGRCWPCPQVRGLAARALVAAGHDAVLAHGHPRLHLVANSRWLEAQASASALGATARSRRTIHYGLDLDVFRPRPRAAARATLGLDPDAPVVLFAAHAVAARRKGVAACLRIVERLRARGLAPRLLTFGELPPPGTPGKHLGLLESDDLLAAVYSAADLFLTTPTDEAFGQMSAEALACGTPVAAFAVGGLVDQVRHGENGVLAPAGDEEGLAAAIATLLGDAPRLGEMRLRARESAAASFLAAREVHDYEALYAEVLA